MSSNMKYTLLKKWHPSQVEEVGHVFEEDEHSEIESSIKNKSAVHFISPHEIALLCEAGYLEKQEELLEVVVKSWNKQADEIVFGNIDTYHDPKLELWTEEPEMYEHYWFIADDGIIYENTFQNTTCHQFRLKTNNCHRTQKSAEEALKRLLEK